MKLNTSIFTTSAGLFLAIAAHGQPTRYNITDLGTLGGKDSYATQITNSGIVSGHASSADGAWRAALWQKGSITDLGKFGLGGRNSIAWDVNEVGRAVGEAETSIIDPDGEDFCGFKALGLPSTGQTCSAFVWQNGVMTPLPTLGGRNAVANRGNNLGDAVGMAENYTRDPACPAPQKFQFKPVLWSNGKIQELQTFPGDLSGIAFGINDNGQVVGSSGSCTEFNLNTQTSLLSKHALLWQNGTMTNLGNLGGTGQLGGNAAIAINNQGQVIGQSDLSGDAANHAFLWQKGVMTDLGTLPGDFLSAPLAINDKGAVAGISIDSDFNLRAFLWQNGVMTDLNTLIGANPAKLKLQLAEAINSRGEIVGFAVNSAGETHAYLATPQLAIVINGPGGAISSTNTFQTAESSIGLSAAQSTTLNPGPLTYSWTLSPGYSSAAILYGNTATPVVQFTFRGTYQLTLKVIDSTGASATTTVTVQYV